jgi:hypothetical protein
MRFAASLKEKHMALSSKPRIAIAIEQRGSRMERRKAR